MASAISGGNRGDRHGKTPAASWGEYGRFELSLLGTNCSAIRKLAEELAAQLTGLSVAYVDADHKAETGNDGRSTFALCYSDKIAFRRIDAKSPDFPLLRKAWFNACDLVLVNGNHFSASLQIAIIDPKKPLQGKLDRLSRPVMVLLQDGAAEIPPQIADYLQQFVDVPVFGINDIGGIAAAVLDLYRIRLSPLYGLVLAGGRSERMGTDKGLVDYHGKPQREHLFDLLQGYCAETFISCRADQAYEFEGSFPYIADSFLGLGQFGAILSAFQRHPDAAWLVLACDLPLLSQRSLNQLTGRRNAGKYATAFHNPESGFTEPLAAIWEPRSYPALLHFLGMGYSCPRKVLLNTDVEILQPGHPEELSNVNSPDDLERVKRLLGRDFQID